MGIGDKLLDGKYQPTKPEDYKTIDIQTGINKVPIKFIHDPIEYVESKDGLSTKLRPLQKKFLEDFYSMDGQGLPRYNSGVMISGMRAGKCFGFLTKILMYDGTLKYAKDIKVGDKVMGPDSKPRNVLEVHFGESEMFEIKQSAAMTYVVNDSHILSLRKAQSTKCNAGKIGKNGRKNYVRYKDEPDIVNIHIKDYLEKPDKWKYFFRGYKAGVIDFEEKELPLDPYFLGIWISDGYKGNQTITNPDIEIREYLKLYATELDMCYYESKDKRSEVYDCGINRKGTSGPNKILNKLKELNLIHNKHIPQIYISNSKKNRLQLLAGLCDGDGYYDRHSYEIASADEDLARQIKLLADTLGFRTNISYKKTKNQYKDFEGEAWRVTIYGNTWEIPCKVERKKYVYNGKSSNKEDYLSGIKVKPIGWGEYVGFGVDGDHLFLLGDGTVVHNSWMAAFVASYQTQLLLEMDNPAQELGQIIGTRLSCQFIASSEAQAKETAFAALVSIIEYNPYWKKYIEYLLEREKDEGGKESLFVKHQGKIEFKEKNLALLSLHSNSGSLAGKTSYCCIFDELSRFDVAEGAVQSRTQKKTADAVYNTVSRAAKSLKPFSKVLTVTSPMYEDDYGMKLLLMAGTCIVGEQKEVINSLRDKQPIKVPGLYGMHATTMEVNPEFTEADFLDEKIASPEAYRRDYLAIPPAALSPFFEYPERIEKCVRQRDSIILFEDIVITDEISTRIGLEMRNYIAKRVTPIKQDFVNRYYLCADAGETKDSFVISMGHVEEKTRKVQEKNGKESEESYYKIIIDFIEEWVPDKDNRITVSFQNVEETIELICHNFNVEKVFFDHWQSSESIQRLFSKGIHTEKVGTKLEMYEEFKHMVYVNQIEFPENANLIKELRQLNKIKNQRIDHPSGGKKDIADSVCRTVYTLYIDYIKDAIQGNYMLPKAARFSTRRGLFNMVNDASINQHNPLYNDPHGSRSDIFGKGTIVTENVVPNLKK